MTQSYVFRVTRQVAVVAESEADARAFLPEFLAAELSSDDFEKLSGPMDPEAIGPLPSNVSTGTGGSGTVAGYSFTPPAVTLVFTTAGAALRAGPPALNPEPYQTIGIDGTSVTFQLPAYASIYKVYQLPAGGYIVFCSIVTQGVQDPENPNTVAPQTGWALNLSLETGFFDPAAGTVNPNWGQGLIPCNWTPITP